MLSNSETETERCHWGSFTNSKRPSLTTCKTLSAEVLCSGRSEQTKRFILSVCVGGVSISPFNTRLAKYLLVQQCAADKTSFVKLYSLGEWNIMQSGVNNAKPLKGPQKQTVCRYLLWTRCFRQISNFYNILTTFLKFYIHSQSLRSFVCLLPILTILKEGRSHSFE